MKNLIAIVALFVSVTALAQEAPHMERMKKMMDATPEEMADIQTKRLTLDLVLDDKQQKEIYNLELANAKERKAKWQERAAKIKEGEKPTEAEREAMRAERKKNYSAMLESQIAHQEKMKEILSEEQFDKWRKMKAKSYEMAKRNGDRYKRKRDHEGERR